MIKVLKALSYSVLILVALAWFGHTALQVKSGAKSGFIANTIYDLSSFPATVIEVLSSNEIRNIPPTYINEDQGFEAMNNLDYSLFAINSFYNQQAKAWDIKLFDLKNDSTIHSWELKKESFNPKRTLRKFENAEPRNPILLTDRSIIIASDETYNLYRIGENSEVLWHNTQTCFHHSLNVDADGNIWACVTDTAGVNHYQQSHLHEYRDDRICKIDVETGQILYEKRINEILIENGYLNFVYGFGNEVVMHVSADPIHLNDIEPALSDSEFWNKGDLFISIRHRSLVFQYRPETNKIIRLFYGPFLNQHDVDIISDHEIAIFNNNCSTVGKFNPDGVYTDSFVVDSLGGTQVLKYNFMDSSYTAIYPQWMEQEKVFTYSEGEFELLSNGDMYVESQNNGKIYLFGQSGTILKKTFKTPINGMIELPHWLRIYEDISFAF